MPFFNVLVFFHSFQRIIILPIGNIIILYTYLKQIPRPKGDEVFLTNKIEYEEYDYEQGEKMLIQKKLIEWGTKTTKQ